MFINKIVSFLVMCDSSTKHSTRRIVRRNGTLKIDTIIDDKIILISKHSIYQ